MMCIKTNYLTELEINFVRQFRLDGRFFDFLLTDYNLLLEADGDYHHGNPKIYLKLNNNQKEKVKIDKIKNNIARKYNYRLVRVWESDIDKKWRIIL